MDFSEGYKAHLPIGSVLCPPLLLPESVVKSTVGPLLFSPSTGTRRTVSPSPSTTQTLGYAKLSLKVDGEPPIYGKSECEFGGIVKIMVNSVWKPADFVSHKYLPPPPSVVTLGYLSACTTHSVHWFKIDWDRKQHQHVLVNLGSEQFSASVLHACWGPLMNYQSLVLLDSGELILFDWGPEPERTSLDVEWKDSDSGTLTSDTRWLSFEFGSHPRIFVIACSDVVYQVDGRYHGKYIGSVLAKIELFADTHEPDKFVAICRAGSGGLNFCIASKYGLYLIDTRKPLSPVLQWIHNLDDKPSYMQVFELSELRSKADRDKYQWATQSGFVILLGSFLDDDFSFFFYGPPVPAPPKSVASIVADLCHTLYAWGHSVYLSLSGSQCYSGDCLIQEKLSNARRPKRKITGFCVITEDLLNIHLERGVGCSFGLIRLLPSGKIESQMYNASWEFDEPSAIEHLEPAESPDEDFCMDHT
ncbi:uncharacterized protein LOC113325039 [Papaver somniferum]|uniref:uncharacterized protein LOC113325039 n=1 Tax=Papaver somniferum TaxID=3469 RepID=UPI000E702814|nr:uncharacterized protein LOC113325039 [Papaver somniferum]